MCIRDRGNSLRSVRLQWCSNVRIDVGGDSFAGVVEAVLNDLHRHARFEAVAAQFAGRQPYRSSVSGLYTTAPTALVVEV